METSYACTARNTRSKQTTSAASHTRAECHAAVSLCARAARDARAGGLQDISAAAGHACRPACSLRAGNVNLHK
jgi:hypothetical protein